MYTSLKKYLENQDFIKIMFDSLNNWSSIFIQFLMIISYVISVKFIGYLTPSKIIIKKIQRIHNYLLSLVSFIMGTIMIYYVYLDNRFDSFDNMSCLITDNQGFYRLANKMYIVSKIWEWFDTYLIVWNKKKMSNLHYFHHATTYTMAAVVHNLPVGAFCFVNCYVHTIMYAYYNNPIKIFKPLVTLIQIIQLSTVLTISFYGYLYCDKINDSLFDWWYCQLVVVGYLILFLKFFIESYIFPKKKNN